MSLLSRFRDDRDDTDRVGLYVDGPNVLRSEFDVDLDEVRKIGESYGPLAVTRLYLDENASPGLIQAGEARGFEVITTSGDVDVRLAVDATEAVASDRIDVLVVASRDTDFKPALEVAARNGVRTVALAPGEHGKSDALQNAAQDGLSLSADVE
ncbi:NYN domain-containing protein [Haloarcula salinisoli]|uniref:NYN domain-containing protein n=1 Tax=Haloarcula salinisoli TaxID=2487746 RepID=A0A8J8CDY8_9EURY|nr:NYN domain-containing protein [Halomicroarcula salinisoli]MBX0305110.1 NYN domain-containing protein [Halomicroarcula salinisoli]